jgi:glycosyltransferase involved in cell wall biosynthesis
MVVLESMARGLPVITTNVGANMDMLENLGGIVVDSPKTELLIRAIDTIMPFETRKKMSEWLFSKVANNYVSSVVLNQLNNAYLEVLGCESDDDAK